MYFLNIWLSVLSSLCGVLTMSCGIDNSPVSHVYEGVARMETYPWLGVLYYPYKNKRITTAVVLVTRQLVVATALEIDKLPKENFRDRARVVIGRNCSAGPSVRIRDYTYHPDYSKNTLSAMALIQLETDHVKIVLRPICPPPRALLFQNQDFFAMVLSENCNRSRMKIYRMMLVSNEECKSFYRRTELDIETLWPSYTACARSVTGGDCVWRSGAILVMKVGTRWSLVEYSFQNPIYLGFGVYGPGCQAPARFLDYGMYHEWVRRSVERIGRPAITKVAPNYVVLRRTLSNVQRFGPCDKGEMEYELYTESGTIQRSTDPIGLLPKGKYYLNLTIIGNVEYSCVILRADYKDHIKNEKPIVKLRRHCAGDGLQGLCFTGIQFIEIQFLVEITFALGLKYSVQAYGRVIKAIDPYKAHKYTTVFDKHPKIYDNSLYKSKLKPFLQNNTYPLYGSKSIQHIETIKKQKKTVNQVIHK